MGADSKIAWTDHTFNPWWGCVRVSPGCVNCYAETFAKRTGHDVWGVESPRRMLSPGYWREPLKWYADAVKAGERRRVFCASMADVCEDRRDLDAPREWLWELIRRTTVGQTWSPGLAYAGGLDWLLLTKRPENLRRLVPQDILLRCWVGTTAEDQQRFDERWPHLQDCPAAVRFLSCEPQLGAIDIGAALPCRVCGGEGSVPVAGGGKACGACFAWAQGSPTRGPFVDWVISGGESGPRARPFDLAWARSLRDQCKAAAVPFFFKQTGSAPQEDQGCEDCDQCDADRITRHASRCSQRIPILLDKPKDRAGADPAEWPEDLRVREWPRDLTPHQTQRRNAR